MWKVPRLCYTLYSKTLEIQSTSLTGMRSSWPQGYKTFFKLNSAENEICFVIKKLNTTLYQFKLFSCKAELSRKFFLLMNIKMPTIVGILISISRKNSCSTEWSMKNVL